MSVSQGLLDAIAAVRPHVADSPAAAAALAALDKQLSSLKVSISLEPKSTLLTDDETPPALKTPLPGVQLSRSTYPANDPSEDRSTVVMGDGFIFAGVWDGHGGTPASEYTQTHIFPNFKGAVDGGASVKEAFALAYKKTDVDYLEHARALNNPAALFAGTCAVAVYIDAATGAVTCGNLGDSRAVMGVYDGGDLLTVPLSEDHSAANLEEQARVRGEHPEDPEVILQMCEDEDDPDWRVKKICAFTRSLGDTQMKDKASATLYNSYVAPQGRIMPRPGVKAKGSDHKTLPYISHDPEIKEGSIKDGFIIVGCDGVWDEMSSDEAVRICAELFASNEGNGANIAELFIEETLKKAVVRIAETIEEEEDITLEELKSRPQGKSDWSYRSCLHDDITVVVLHFSGGGSQVYDASKLGSSTLATARELFKKIDADGSGSLDKSEIEALTIKLGKRLQGKELDSTFAEMDTDGDGDVDYAEFEAWWNKQQSKSSTSKQRGGISDAIATMSKEIEKQKEDAARQATNAQIMQMMEVFEGMNPQQLKILFDALDADGNGTLDREEVERLVSQVLKTAVTPMLVDTAFGEMDYDKSGTVEFSEFSDFFGIS